MAQQATAIKENRTKTTLVVDAGDTIQANSAELFLNDDVHPMISAQNAIGYDVDVTGNHEYNYGMATLEKVLSQQKAKVDVYKRQAIVCDILLNCKPVPILGPE